MKISLLTNEYPPNVYGGAGVHVEYLTRELASLDARSHEIQVLCFGDQRVKDQNLTVFGVNPDFVPPFQDERHKGFQTTMLKDVVMAGLVDGADVVHCHTWYAHLGGLLAKQLAGARLVLTTHSLEPHRPWKVEQLGTGYHGSSWIERTAYQNADGVIAVSESMKQDVHDLYDVPFERIRVIPNGIDIHQYRPTEAPDVLRRYGIDPDRPFVLFVGRITRQKGIIHLVNAIRYLPKDFQVVLCAGAPDTPEIGAEMEARVSEVQAEGHTGIVWVRQMVPREDVIAIYSHASLFVCPSVYEPFGIINLEAMACRTPVVASKVGGIPEIVVPGETGVLVPFERRGPTDFEPVDPDGFAHDLAESITSLMLDSARRDAMGEKSRTRVEQTFSWTAIAERTLAFYRELASA